MAKAAVLASGNGGNFQAIAEALAARNKEVLSLETGETPGKAAEKHEISFLICDRKNAGCFVRAKNLGIPAFYIPYVNRDSREAESEILEKLSGAKIQIVFLAGFMRLLSPAFLDAFPGDVINIHPSLLPRHSGAHGIRDSFESGDRQLGITIHKVDYGMDTGPVIRQAAFQRESGDTLEEIEEKIHRLEHQWYPAVALELLDGISRR